MGTFSSYSIDMSFHWHHITVYSLKLSLKTTDTSISLAAITMRQITFGYTNCSFDTVLLCFYNRYVCPDQTGLRLIHTLLHVMRYCLFASNRYKLYLSLCQESVSKGHSNRSSFWSTRTCNILF